MKITAPNGFVYFITAASVAASGAADTPKPQAPPPPIETVRILAPPPPPPVMIASETAEESARVQRAMQEIVTFDIEVTGGTERLWLGTMRVSSQHSGDHTSSLRQAPLCASSVENARYHGGQQNQLNVSLQRRSFNRDVDGFNVRVTWTHPRNECERGGGQATVGFEQGFTLRPGATTQLVGDGGLTVKVTRRR